MNFFDIKKKNNRTVFLINSEIIDDNFMAYFSSKLSLFSNIGLDMAKVKTIKSKKFIELLEEGRYKLFNLKNEVLLYLMLIKKHGFLHAYNSFEDFCANKREFIKRKFLIV